MTIKVKYRGGPEAWFEIHARGSMGRFHGATSLFDVMSDICQQGYQLGETGSHRIPLE